MQAAVFNPSAGEFVPGQWMAAAAAATPSPAPAPVEPIKAEDEPTWEEKAETSPAAKAAKQEPAAAPAAASPAVEDVSKKASKLVIDGMERNKFVPQNYNLRAAFSVKCVQHTLTKSVLCVTLIPAHEKYTGTMLCLECVVDN